MTYSKEAAARLVAEALGDPVCSCPPWARECSRRCPAHDCTHRDNLRALAEQLAAASAEVERLRESTDRGDALIELHRTANEKAELATVVDLLEAEANDLTGTVMSLASDRDSLRAALDEARRENERMRAVYEACREWFMEGERPHGQYKAWSHSTTNALVQKLARLFTPLRKGWRRR